MALDFTLSDEQHLARTAVRSMLKGWESRSKEVLEVLHHERRFPEDLWRDYAAVGLQGALIPERYGGSGAGLLALTLGFEEIGAIGFSPGLLLVTAMDTSCILRNGSPQLKERFLPRIADGSWKLCFAVTEPDAGSNTFRIKTQAQRRGDRYVVTGQKYFISGADVADFMLLVARTTSVEELQRQGKPLSHGLSLFLVDTKSSGIEKVPIKVPAAEGMTQFHLFFDDLEVPPENLLGEEDAGARAMFTSLNPERILAASMCLGLIEYALRKAVSYASERRVFREVPIGAYQSIAHPLAEAKILQESARLMTYRAACAFDSGAPPVEVGGYANMAKFLAADALARAVDAAIETHGGLGFAEETGLIFLWNRARLLKTAPVTREMILNHVSESLGLPRSY